MLSALDRFVDPPLTAAVMATLPVWPRPAVYKMGAVGGTIFVYTVDADGHTELSITRKSGPLTASAIAAFFRVAGLPVPPEPPFRIHNGRGRMWVLKSAA